MLPEACLCVTGDAHLFYFSYSASKDLEAIARYFLASY
ncbi:hypothetical protein SeseC_01792 [Streptococcus equi subsp. zooepidemicus ATCC 35246]|nr:hypothetical protein SeseC_01792 [Streptococcus equi subsp. zooepidemicus ATCC 35246]